MMQQELLIERIAPTGAAEVIDVLWESFYHYPVMRFVLGESYDYDRRIARLIALFVAARALNNDMMLGVCHGGELVATVTTSDPADAPHPDLAVLRDRVWEELGAPARERYELCVAAWGALAIDTPQLHVNMLGVRRAHQRGGLARGLLRQVHAIAEGSPKWHGVSLTTEDPRNVPFYERQGYRVIGKRMISPELQTWSFFRSNSAAQ
jgi:GNAT superfamily N-acetyltransferase